MNHRETVTIVARYLPHVPRHTVAEVLEVVSELWAEELAQPGNTVTVMGLGRLHIEAQQMRVRGAIREKLIRDKGSAPDTMRRLYYRFRPSGWLREKVEAGHEEASDT